MCAHESANLLHAYTGDIIVVYIYIMYNISVVRDCDYMYTTLLYLCDDRRRPAFDDVSVKERDEAARIVSGPRRMEDHEVVVDELQLPVRLPLDAMGFLYHYDIRSFGEVVEEVELDLTSVLDVIMEESL